MWPSRVCVWTLLACLVPSVCAQDDFLAPEPLHAAGLTKYWQLRLPLDRGQEVCDAYVVDDQIYLATQDGYVYAVDAPTGVLRWVRPVLRSTHRLRRPCHADDRTIIVTPVDVQIYARRTGDPIERWELRFPCSGAAITDGRRLYVGGLDSRLHVFDLETGQILWRVLVDGPIPALPVLVGDFLVIPSESVSVYACHRVTKAFGWQVNTTGFNAADLVADDNGVYIASQDQSLYLVNPEFGQIKWRVRCSSPLREPPFVTPTLAFQYSPADGIVAIETGAGLEIGSAPVRWRLAEGRHVLATHDNTVFVLTRGGDLLAVNVIDGVVRQAVPSNGLLLALPVRGHPTVLLAAADGRVFCARPLGVPPLRAEDIRGALRPPGGTSGSSAASQPTTRPAAGASKTTDPLSTGDRGVPLGGKSSVTRELQGRDRRD